MLFYLKFQLCEKHYKKYKTVIPSFEYETREKTYNKHKEEFVDKNIFFKEKISKQHKVLEYCSQCYFVEQDK